MPQIASCKKPVIYRHTGSGGTKFARYGDELPESSEDGIWEPLAQDNMSSSDSIVILFGKGLIFAFMSDFIPEVGQLLNLRHGFRFPPLPGSYRVTEVGTMNWMGNEEIHFSAEHVGDIDPENVIFYMGLQNC